MNEIVSIPAAEILRNVSAQTLAAELLERVKNGHSAPAARAEASALPAIGAAYEGCLYAGLTLDDGKPAALVLLPGDESNLTWDKAVEWAKAQGGTLPSRIDQLVLFKNLKGEFQQVWYWSGEPSAGNDAFALAQGFYYGDQDFFLKSDDLQARAVRRFPL